MEFRESIQQLKNSLSQAMDYLIKQEDILDLKMEENSDQYLFNSLLDIGNIQPQCYIGQDLHPYSFFEKQNSEQERNRTENENENILHQISHLYNLRTTPLHDLMDYIEQAYALSDVNKKALLISLKRYKLQLKRENAKKRVITVEKVQEIHEEIKVEENPMSELCFDDQSQETKKKKRNRMSAQKSRDRKKQYIKQIQKINKQYKRKIEEINAKNRHKVKPASREFVKVLLCLGITCFLNAAPHNAQNSQSLVDQERPSTESISTLEVTENSPKLDSKFDLEAYKKLLPMSQQMMLEEAIESMCGVEQIIEIKSSSEFQDDENEEAPPDKETKVEKGKKGSILSKRSASSCSTS